MHVTIMGRRWEWKIIPRSAMPVDKDTKLPHDGLCDPPETRGRKLRFAHDLHGQNELETNIHEMIHAVGWHIDEPFASQAAADIARTLWRLGWRKS